MSYLSMPTKENGRIVSGLALPIVVASLSQTLMSLIDIAMVGRLGAAAVAAVGLAGLTTFSVAALLGAIQVGVQTVAARRKGEGRFNEVADTFRVSFRLALVLGHLVALGFVAAVPALFPMMVADPAVHGPGAEYLAYRGLSLGAVMTGTVFYGFYNAIGRTRIHMLAALVANTVNVVLNYGLIFGRLGLPEMGPAGAGLATAIASGVTVLLYLIPMMMPRLNADYPGLWRGPLDMATLKKVVRVWLPASVHEVGVLAGFVVFMMMMGRISTVALAASEILLNIISFSFLPALGFSHAAQTLVSQSIGEGRPERGKTLTETATVLCIFYMGSLGILFILLPELLLKLFTTDVAVVAAAVPALRVLGFVQVADAVGMVHYGALRGAGDVLFPALTETAIIWLVFLPLTWLLGVYYGLGVLGGWLALATHLLIYSTVFLLRFSRGRWMTLQV